MSFIEHGEPGGSIAAGGGKYSRDAARRGGYFERTVAGALRTWLGRRADTLHLMHDLGNFNQIGGAGLPPLSLGAANVDHLVVGGERWLLFDAKGCGAGTLQLDDRGRGVLVKDDGGVVAQPWLNSQKTYSLMGAVYRLTEGVGGQVAWVLPDHTDYTRLPVNKVRAFAKSGGFVLHVSELAAGGLDEHLPDPQPPASPATVQALRQHLLSG
ncbi:hypothetical protein GCM10010123_19330 [Pilimelia anulata]|uniref:NERD domain-containing protein n=1 Tax=Pilimelia anulata TaxID=53371 RepID=A0A8J3B1X7_9ACTN|nr:hypothetical protein [Pilimelia anulata]GGJ89682.1 hypothetical protein GCM10010123_19330 [Pilimelia anulata]